MFNVYCIQDLLKLLMLVVFDDKMFWVVKFFSVSPSVMYGTVMKWLGQAVYSCTVTCVQYSCLCTLYSRATSTLTSAASRAPESGRAGELSRVQCEAGHEIIWNKSFTIKILRFASNASEWGPEILKLSETNHLQFVLIISFAANGSDKGPEIWNLMKKQWRLKSERIIWNKSLHVTVTH